MTLGSHQTTVGKSQNHLTPKWIIDALGPFDLDPCAATPRPWDCARINFPANGLDIVWKGRVWLNPPFNRYEVGRWIEKLARHGDGVALLHARTETAWFDGCWKYASGVLFLADRLKFCRPDGTEQPANSGAPVVLVGFGRANAEHLKRSSIGGVYVDRWYRRGAA